VTTALAFVFVLGVLVFVHELGHFLMARWLGVRVITFSLGFPPRIWGFKRGDTDYCIGAIPLGGYVKMAGENPDDPRSGGPDEFLSRPKWDRFRILLAGPVMNLVLSFILMTVVLLQGAQVPSFQDDPVVVGAVTAGSPAERGGIKPGDRVIKVGSHDVATWDQFFLVIGARANQDVPLTVLRQGLETKLTVRPEPQTKYEVGEIGILPDVHPKVTSVEAGGPADKAGIKVGDLVRAIDGETMVFSRQLTDTIRKHPKVPIVISVTRGSAGIDITVTPELSGTIGRIAIGIGDAVKTIQPGPLGAVKLSLQKNVEFGGLIVQTLVGMLTRETSPRQLMGPVAIAQLSGDYAAAGWVALATFMASLSLNLGLLNLLPIPVLDGGAIFIMLLEGLVRRDFSLRMKERMLMVGFALLMTLMVTVVYNDLTRIQWIDRLLPWRH
jgi:regulator of sigma E protease